MNDRLLAKSRPADGRTIDSIYLAGHLRDVHAAALEVLACSASEQLAAFGLTNDEWSGRLHASVLLASAIHDLGKANDHFQGMLEPQRWPVRSGKCQGLRHEWVTLIAIRCTSIGSWLQPVARGDELAWYAALWAVTGHHPAYGRPSPPTGPPEGAGSEMKLLLGNSEVKRALTWLVQLYDLPDPPALSDITIGLVGTRNAFDEIRRFQVESKMFWSKTNTEDRRFVAAVKDSVVGADIAGSALPRYVSAESDRRNWIRQAFARVPTSDDISEVICDRLRDENGTVHPLRPFQRAVADRAQRVTLVKAGCGTGKTLAAYHWARERCPNRRLYMCYPTTGTATEGFRDYLVSGESPKFDARLFHGRASVDLKMLNIHPRDGDELEEVVRIESLDAWSTPIVVCTVDTVLGLMQNNRRGLYAWPALAGAAFVFDEIHAYDDDLFSSLLRFLADLPRIHVLLMTASLPRDRYEALRNVMKDSMAEVAGPEELEILPRYIKRTDVDCENLRQMVDAELSRGGKVLWVVNTVDRAIQTANLMESAQPILYHSRFRYEDRVQQHARVIDAFDAKKNPGPALAVCTQVAEMSLDLSSTLLVSELAPVPALIQRLGRLNRRAVPPKPGQPPPPAMPFVIIVPKKEDGSDAVLPYKASDFETARRWLAALPESNISQRDLVQAWEQSQAESNHRIRPGRSAWLDGGPVTEVQELRRPSPGITVILEQDVSFLEHSDPSQRKFVAEVALPMPPPPRHFAWREWERYQGIPIAPESSIMYHPSTGAQWCRTQS